MCFSAEADFAAAVFTAPVGVLALRWAPTRADLPIAALPLLFAVHQGVEGFVWLGFDGTVGAGLSTAAIVVYLLIAQVVLPLLVPFGVRAIEPIAWRRRALLVPAAAGVAVAAWVIYVMSIEDIAAHPERNAVIYETDYRIGTFSTAAYAISTLGAVLLTSRRRLLAFGLVNAAGFGLAALVRYESVTSVWCAYAALTSAIVLVHLRQRRREERVDAGPDDGDRRRVAAATG
ncbi:MAG: hypothetical protein PGN13_09280 [Patulibacter minatonensis]